MPIWLSLARSRKTSFNHSNQPVAARGECHLYGFCTGPSVGKCGYFMLQYRKSVIP
jgi:hypothetical protein